MNVLLRMVVVTRTATTQLEATTVAVTIPTPWLWIVLHAAVGINNIPTVYLIFMSNC